MNLEQGAMTPEPVAGRLHSGLVRSFGTGAAFLFGIHCISLSSSGFIPFSWVASVWPGADIVWVLTIAALLCCFHGASYAIIGGTVSKAGADYVFASRALSPRLGFAASWTLVLFSGFVAGGLAAWVPKSAVPALLRPMAIILEDPSLAATADLSSGPTGTMVLGALVILTAMISVLGSNKFLRNLLFIGFVLGAVAWLAIYYSFATADGPDAFKTAWNHFMANSGEYGAYEARVGLAQAAGMEINSSGWSMTLAGLIMGFWIYYGYYIPTFFSEEVRNPAKSLLVSSLGSIVVAYAIFALATVLLQRLVPLEWIAAEGYLFNNPDAAAEAAHASNVVAMPWVTFYSGILNPNKYIIFFVAFAWIFTLVNLVQTYFFYSSRIVYSWALDRVVPDWLVGPSVHQASPRRSVLFFTVFALVGLADASFNGPLGTQLTFVFFAVSTQLVPIAALTFLPGLNRRLFDELPAFARRKYFGIALASWVGGVTLLYLIWMIAAAFLFPAVGIANPAGTLTLFVILVASGFLEFEVIRRYRLRKQGIDILDTYASPVNEKSSEMNLE